jgi:CBS-domain-containing membrane protein
MNNLSDRKKLTNFIDEAVIQRTKIKTTKEDLKAIVDEAKEQLDIEPKLFNALVSITEKNSFAEKQAEISNLETAIELLISSHG